MRRSLTLLVALVATALFTSTPATAGDPAKATVTATLVDESGKPIELLRKPVTGEVNCLPVMDWRNLGTERTGMANGPHGWCVSGVTIMAQGNAVYKTPSATSFYVDDYTDKKGEEMAAKVNGKVKFDVFPGVGTIVLSTDPIGSSVYYAEIDSSTLKPGVDNPVEVVMQTLPKIQIVSPMHVARERTLMNFGDGVVWPKTKTEVSSVTTDHPARRPVRVARPIDPEGYGIAGTWFVQPGQYMVRGELIPPDAVAMIRQGNTVTMLDASKPITLALGDTVVISVGRTTIE